MDPVKQSMALNVRNAIERHFSKSEGHAVVPGNWYVEVVPVNDLELLVWLRTKKGGYPRSFKVKISEVM